METGGGAGCVEDEGCDVQTCWVGQSGDGESSLLAVKRGKKWTLVVVVVVACNDGTETEGQAQEQHGPSENER